MRNKILEALSWRYATKIFDLDKKISDDDLHTILESARLSPSSMGVEMWKFIVVENKEKRIELRKAGFNQSKITDSSHLIILTYRTDEVEKITKELLERTARIQNINPDNLNGLKDMVNGSLVQKQDSGSLEDWIKLQTYIPLGMMIETAALLEIDTCPMEGFISSKVDEILELNKQNLKSIAMLSLGYRDSEKDIIRKKVRRDFGEVVEFI